MACLCKLRTQHVCLLLCRSQAFVALRQCHPQGQHFHAAVGKLLLTLCELLPTLHKLHLSAHAQGRFSRSFPLCCANLLSTFALLSLVIGFRSACALLGV